MQVLLVGGATRMPAFRRFVENMTGLQPRETFVDPDEVCAEHSLTPFRPSITKRRFGWDVLMIGVSLYGAELLTFYVQAVALGAAVHAGILEGSVADIMVMDIWQASLLRALAKQQLRDAATSLDQTADTTSEDPVADFEDGSTSSGDTAAHSAVQTDAMPADGGDDEWGPAELDLEDASAASAELQQRTHV